MNRSEVEALEALMRYRRATSRSDYLDKLAAIYEIEILAKLSKEKT